MVAGFDKKISEIETIVKEKYAAEGGPRYQVSAFSGGAADIQRSPEGRFSDKYIGTGTASRAFGWGLYFTSKAEVAKRYAEIAARLRGEVRPGSRHLHNVTLHKGKTADQYDYLDWHGRPTDRQVNKVRNQLQLGGYRKASQDKALFGENGEQLYKGLSEMFGSDEAASRFLLKAGIDGVTYRADYVMDYAPEGTRNYVE